MDTIIKGNWQGTLNKGLALRELEYTMFLLMGWGDKRIAREAGVQPCSVRKRLDSARFKLRVDTRVQLVAEAMRRAIITPLLLLLMVAMTAVQATPDHQPVTRNRIVRVKGGGRRDADVSVFRIC